MDRERKIEGGRERGAEWEGKREGEKGEEGGGERERGREKERNIYVNRNTHTL